MHKKALMLYIMVFMIVPLAALPSGEKKPKEKRNRLDTRGAIHGSGFRITVIHPFRGDFSEYDKLEIVNTTSDVGDAVPVRETEDYTKHLLRSFQKSGLFKEVRTVNQVKLAQAAAATERTPAAFAEGQEIASLRDSAPSADGKMALLSEPFLSSSPSNLPYGASPNGFGVPPVKPGILISDPQAVQPKRTMIIVSRVIYYQKGNRTLRAVGYGGGYSRFVVRFCIYDKERGVELAMGNISGEVQTSFYSVPFMAGDAEGRDAVVSAIVNRVEVRKVTADQ